MNDVYISWLEWEALDDKLEIRNIARPCPLHESIERILVTRNDDYGLNAEITGEGDRVFLKVESPSKRKGEEISLTTISGNLPEGSVVTLSGYYEGRTTFSGKLAEQFYVKMVGVDYAPTLEPKWLSIWCLNGPRTQIMPSRVTKRVLHTNISRSRAILGGTHGELDHRVEATGGAESHSRDYWLLTNKYFKLRLCNVPEAFGPNWSRNVAVELLEYPNRSFSLLEAQVILGALGFLFGARFIPVGCSWFSENDFLIRSESFVPWGTNLKQECSQQAMPPISLQQGGVEKVVGKILEQIFSLNEEMDFSAGMIGYWLSRLSPAEAAFANIASGLESLMNAWFKSKRSRSQAQYLPQAEFNAVTTEPFCQVERALSGVAHADRILRRLKQANSIGSNEKFERFFEEIELPIGEVEKYAISVRNRFVHGAGAVPTEKVHNLVYTLRSYQSMFHRILLRLIGYQGKYVDYSCLGFPERPLLEPLAGPEGNGKPLRF